VADWPVAVVDHDPHWALAFLAEAHRLRRVLPADVLAIEHVGSTAVPGLAAKPIIDVLLGVRRLAGAGAHVRGLEQLGYTYLPTYEQAMPYRRLLRRREDDPPAAHIHLVERTHPFFTEHLVLRDYLRLHPDEADRYGALKRRLAAAHRDDREAYMDGKDGLLRELNQRALAWAAELLASTAAWSSSHDR
jgi:GrpB-like predicted nucleotidyltransferase (UPF0157 family)